MPRNLSAQDQSAGAAGQAFGLKISNLDRDDPPGYAAGAVLRSNGFNANVFRIAPHPRMPMIEVHCDTVGFAAQNAPIYWRLQCLHVLCRHQSQGSYRYRGVCEVLTDEWQGKSRKNDFTLFLPVTDADIDYDYNTNEIDGPVMGGNAILTVTAKPPGCSSALVDYVHIRLVAADNPNPAKTDVLSYLDRQMSGRDGNINHMIRAVFAHENDFTQFCDGVQTSATMHFVQKHHQNIGGQPDCAVRFDWPDDPAHFPSVSFDWGVGISQFTKIRGRTIGRGPVWDWRENINSGINEFLSVLRGTFQAHSTWRAWAKRAWKGYNGSGPQADAYANTLEMLPDGQAVSQNGIPANLDVNVQTASISGLPARPDPPAWPPSALT